MNGKVLHSTTMFWIQFVGFSFILNKAWLGYAYLDWTILIELYMWAYLSWAGLTKGLFG